MKTVLDADSVKGCVLKCFTWLKPVAVAIDEPISNEAFDKAELAMDECPTSAIHSKED